MYKHIADCFRCVAVALFVVLAACSHNAEMARQLHDLHGVEIVYPAGLEPVKFGSFDGVARCDSCEYRIVSYVDSTGCTSCRLKLPGWERFIARLDSIASGRVEVMLYLHSQDYDDIAFIMEQNDYRHFIALDADGEFKRLNRFPDNRNMHTFLIDGSNRVVAVGNPVQSIAIRNLMIDIIDRGLHHDGISE